MHALFVSHYFFPEGNAPATRVYQLARRWVARGAQVTVLTGAPNVPGGQVYPGYRNRIRPQTEEIEGIHVVRVWTHIAANQGFVRRVANYLSFMISATLASLRMRAPDVVVATSPQFFCGWAGAFIARLKGRPFVLEVRDLWPESIVAVGALERGFLLRVLEWLELRLYRSASHIVTVGDGYRRGLLERGVPANKVTVIPNGVDADEFSPRPPDQGIQHAYGLEGKLVCAYLGTIGMACGLDVVLRAAMVLEARADRRFVFLLVGDGAVREQLQFEAAEAGLEGVIFVGRQAKERMPAFLSVTDVCLVHLRRTALFRRVLPSKIFEALAMAKPVLLGVEGDAAGLIEASGGGLCFEPEDEEALLKSLTRFADDPELGRSLGEAGRRFVLEHFDRNEQASEYLQLLEALAN